MAQIRKPVRWVAMLLLGTLLVSACDGRNDSAQDGAPGGKLVVFAAASLQESFTELKKEFEQRHPDVGITLNFAGSSTLARQVRRGAPADVFASANAAQMRNVVEAGGMVGDPRTFVRNELRIAVPAGNPAGVEGIEVFGAEQPRIAVCAAEVPCGAAARRALDAAGVELRADTLEDDVKAVLTKVRLGEVDAGLVYRTDIVAAGDEVEGIDFAAAGKAVNDYEIGRVADAQNSAAAREFVTFVHSRQAQRILADHGFETDVS